MGRKRINDEGLPSRVYPHRDGYIYRPPNGGKAVIWKSYMDMITGHAALMQTGVIAAPTGQASVTIGSIIDHYLVTELHKLAPDTASLYKRYILKIRAVIGDLHPERLRPRDLYAMVDGITQSPSVRNMVIALTRNIFAIAIRKGACDVNVAREVSRDPPPQRERTPALWELEEFKKVGGPWWACYIDFKLATGLRQKDMIELPPLPMGSELFDREISKSMRWHAASKKRVGRVTSFEVGEEVREILRRLYALKRPQNSQRLFCTPHGKVYKRQNFNRAFLCVLRKLEAQGIEAFHEHDIRATVAEADPDNAQARLTHKHHATTEGYLRGRRRDVVPTLSRELLEKRAKGVNNVRSIHQKKAAKA